jgi:hypothetical protein
VSHKWTTQSWGDPTRVSFNPSKVQTFSQPKVKSMSSSETLVDLTRPRTAGVNSSHAPTSASNGHSSTAAGGVAGGCNTASDTDTSRVRAAPVSTKAHGTCLCPSTMRCLAVFTPACGIALCGVLAIFTPACGIALCGVLAVFTRVSVNFCEGSSFCSL